MKFWPVILLIFVSCSESNDSVDNGKCLSCHFFLGKKGDENYVILHESKRSKKMEVIVDSIENINWQKCSVFFQRKTEYTVLSLAGDSSQTVSFQSEDEMFKYCKINRLTFDDRLLSSSDVYQSLGTRIACE